MATYKKTCSNNSNYSLRLELSESSVSIANNTSVVTYDLYLDSTYARFEDWNVTYTLDLGDVVHIDKTELLSMPATRKQPLLLASGSKTVTHNSSGAKSLSVSCSVSTPTSQSYLPGSATISGYTFVLTTIARKSTLHNVSATINNQVTLTVTRQNSNFTHTIKYSFGSVSATIVTKSSSTSISWTPPLSLYLQIIGKSSGTGKISIETFNGSTSLGTNTYTLTLKATEVYNVPRISNLRYERGNSGGSWVANPNGASILVKFTASVTTGIPGNTTNMVVSLSNGAQQTRSNISSTNFAIEFDSIGTTASYTLTIDLTDTIGSSKSWNLTISTIDVPFDINVELPGAAFGKISEKSKSLECSWDAEFGGDVEIVGTATIKSGAIELNPGGALSSNGGFIDFHYGGSTESYTSRIIESGNGQLNLYAPNGVKINDLSLSPESVTLTVVSGRLTNLSYTARYYPMLGMCFVRIYGKINANLNTGYDYDLLNISSRVPSYGAALAVKCGKDVMAIAQSNGVISLRPMGENIAASAGWAVYITGFWFA